jgi:hypothetical protein
VVNVNTATTRPVIASLAAALRLVSLEDELGANTRLVRFRGWEASGYGKVGAYRNIKQR